jgi:pSer/pThr/pTyr-binding forkhead associated (FHA) protein
MPSRAGGVVVVGREKKSADVCLPIGTVSAAHARFERDEDGRVFVSDLGSRNGTEVDGRPVPPGGPRFELSSGDVVTLGDPHLARFEVVETTGRDIADAAAGLRETAAEAGKNAEAVAATVNNARAALSGVGDVFRGFGGGGKAASDTQQSGTDATEEEAGDAAFASEALATIDVDDVDDDDDDDEIDASAAETVVPTSVSEPAEVFSSSQNKQPPTTTKVKFASEERVVFAPVGWSGPAVELEPGVPARIGSGRRKGDADVLLTNVAGVDSAHASVLRVGGAVYIEDLGSKRGTFVGGRQIKPGLQYELTEGADVQLGDGGCAFTVTRRTEEEEDGDFDLQPPPAFAGGSVAPAATRNAPVSVARGADVSLSKVDDGSDPAASPWGLMGGLKGVGENLGAAIFNSKIQVNYQYKPEINVGGKSGSAAGLADLKAALLLALADTERGLRAEKDRVKKIEQLARALEAKNPTRSPLKSPLMNGRWALQYTTATSVLGKGKPGFARPRGPIHQTVDIFTAQVKNEESFEPLPFLKFTNASVSSLDAQTDSRASVRPKAYTFAGFKVDAPPASVGRAARDLEMEASGSGSLAWMDTTFVDDELRISRSQSGDVFILVRDDPNDE